MSDRTHPPCTNCGAELYDRFWGNGGWAATEVATNKAHGPEDCVKVLRARVAELEAALDHAPAEGDVSEVKGVDEYRRPGQ